MKIYFIKYYFREFPNEVQLIESVWKSKIDHLEETFYKNKIYSKYERGERVIK